MPFNRLKNLKDVQVRSKYTSIIKKNIFKYFKPGTTTTPIFIFGVQRSGTTMMMNSFHQHPDIEVFDESISSRAFENFQIRNFQCVKELINKSKYPFTVFKTLADSHFIDRTH